MVWMRCGPHLGMIRNTGRWSSFADLSHDIVAVMIVNFEIVGWKLKFILCACKMLQLMTGYLCIFQQLIVGLHSATLSFILRLHSCMFNQLCCYSVMLKLFTSHKPLLSHVPLLAEGRQTQVSEGKQKTGLCRNRGKK